MKKFTLLASILFFFTAVATAQMENPVKWTYTAKKIANKTYEIHITANIDGNWHLYSQFTGEGPEPTSFKFDKNPLIKLDGNVIESGHVENVYDPNFKSTMKYFSKQVDFIQKVTLRSSATTIVKGVLTYMVCNDNRCLPPKDVPFSVKIDGK